MLSKFLDPKNAELDRFSWNDEELRTYEQTEKYEGALMAAMEQKFDEGEAKGRARGKAEGKVEIAKTLIDDGYEIQFIHKITKLSIEEIEQIKFNQVSSIHNSAHNESK